MFDRNPSDLAFACAKLMPRMIGSFIGELTCYEFRIAKNERSGQSVPVQPRCYPTSPKDRMRRCNKRTKRLSRTMLTSGGFVAGTYKPWSPYPVARGPRMLADCEFRRRVRWHEEGFRLRAAQRLFSARAGGGIVLKFGKQDIWAFVRCVTDLMLES